MPAKKTIEEVRKILSEDSEYEIVEPLNYVNMREKNIKMKHKLCGTIFYISLHKWCDGQRAHRCKYHKSTIRKTTEEFCNEVAECPNSSDYKVIGEYVNKRTKIEMLHISKNHTFFIAPEDFLDGCRCNICFGTHLKTTEEFKKEVKQISKKYEVIGDYIHALKKIKMKHLSCGHEFDIRPNDFLAGHGCPYCKESYYEKQIEGILINNDIKYTSQKIFKDCRDKLPLRFDFYLPEYNACIEYDGEFHYFNCIVGVDTLQSQQRRDKIKTEYCKSHNIPLLRIPYTKKDNIEDLVLEYCRNLKKSCELLETTNNQQPSSNNGEGSETIES